MPYGTSFEEIRDYEPDGIVVCNGPGDPEVDAVAATVATTARLIQRYPLLGICLGHQIIALAAGARTSRLKFGHRGANHPVLDLARAARRTSRRKTMAFRWMRAAFPRKAASR